MSKCGTLYLTEGAKQIPKGFQDYSIQDQPAWWVCAQAWHMSSSKCFILIKATLNSTEGEILPGILFHHKGCLTHWKCDKISSVDLDCFTALILHWKFPCIDQHYRASKLHWWRLAKMALYIAAHCIKEDAVQSRYLGLCISYPERYLYGRYLPGCMRAPHLNTAWAHQLFRCCWMYVKTHVYWW